MDNSFEWKNAKQLTILQTILAFLLPSSFAFVGFRVILPMVVNSGYPKILAWPIIASIMLTLFIFLGLFLNVKEAKTLNISLKERLCLKKISGKKWGITILILFAGLILSLTMRPVVTLLASTSLFAIPDYMPFWLIPSIDPMNTPMDVLSPGFDLKGKYIAIVIMAYTLLSNILAEEIYFRAYLLPKMQGFGKKSWVINGVMFALYHTYQLWLFPMMVIVSLATTLSVYLSKSIWPAFTIHIIGNFLLGILGVIALVMGLG